MIGIQQGQDIWRGDNKIPDSSRQLWDRRI